MYMLELFDSEAAEPCDVRLLRDGTLRIGRDRTADWPITDPDCALSRTHCEVTAFPDRLTLRALGSNGVYDDAGTRLPDAVDTALPVPGSVRMGRFRLAARRAPMSDLPGDTGRTMILTAPLGASTLVPGDWADATPAVASAETGSLLEAFCQGAGLDASLLSSEPPEEIMRRAGQVYRQMVLGVGDLMAERDRARARFRLTRTTIGGADNNPFKWAPSRRLAIDLLLGGSTGFLSGPEALKASFGDLKRHLVATFAGLQGSLRAAIDRFDPVKVEAASASRASLLKGRGTMAMTEVGERHAALVRELDEAVPGALDRAFVQAYDMAEWGADRRPS